MTDALASSRFRLLTVRELLDRPEPVDVIRGLVPTGGKVMLFGKSGDGKSFVGLDWALNVAGGAQDWFGHAIQPGPVVYIVSEGAGAFHRRVAAWLRAQHLEDVAAIRFIYDAAQLLEIADTAMLVETVRAWEPAPVMILFDTLHANMPGGEENSAKDSGLVIHSLNHICRETGAAVVLIHHPQKHGEDERGSSALKAAMDVQLKLAADEDGTLTLRSTKVKDGPPLERVSLRLVGFEGSAIICEPDGHREPAALSAHDRTALDALVSIALDDGVTCSQWRDSSGLSEATFMRVRKRLVDDGRVIVAKKRYRVAPHTDMRPSSQLSNNSHGTLSESPATPTITAFPSLEEGKRDSKARQLAPGDPGYCVRHPAEVDRAPTGELACRVCRPELWPAGEPV